MMKKLRLFIFSIVALVASFCLSSNVFAFYAGEYVGHDYYDSPLTTTAKAVKGTEYSTYSMYKHYTYYGGSKYTMYCLDAARKSGGKNANLYVSRVLNQNNPKDAVILAIISDSGYNALEKTMAIRAFIPLSHDLSKHQTIVSYEYNEGVANANSGIKWAAESDVAAYTKAIFGLNKVSTSTVYGVAYTFEKYNSKKILNEDNYYVKEAKKLFKKALKYGAQVANGKVVTQKKITYTEPILNKEKYEIVYENGQRKTEKEILFTAAFEKFNDGSTDPVNIVINPDTNGVAVGTVYQYQIAGTDTWVTFDSKTDFKPLLTSDKVVINFKIGAKAPSTKSKITINFKVDVQYQDDKVLTGALLYNSKKATQRFFIYDEEPGKHSPYQKPIEWPDIIVQCTNDVPPKDDVNKYKTYMNECCRGHNDAEFSIIEECNTQLAKAKTDEEKEKILKENKYCQLKAEYCDICNTKITVPKTCSEFSEGEFEKGLTAKIEGPDEIKVCVMDGEDEANQSYKLTKELSMNGITNYSFKDNKYCKVSCKEDYEFDLPTGRYVISGRYFTLKMGVAATKTCYTDMIDYQSFEKDAKDYADKLNTYIAAGTATPLNTEFVNLYNEYKGAINDIQACSLGWDTSYNVDPEISFDYDEEYIEKLLGGDLKFVVGNDKKTTETKWFCNGTDVDRKYNECIGAKATSEAQTKTVDVIECSTSNATSYNCTTVSKEIPTSKYAKVATKVEASYAPESIFFTKYSTGVINIKDKISNSDIDKYTKLDSYLDSKIDDSIKIKTGALPVSLKDGKGVYNYNIKFNNVGEYFDKSGFGRLVGGKQAVALVNNDTTFQGTYVCSYVVNCPECNVTCIDDPARGIFCNLDNDDPTPECVGTCAFDANVGELYSVHQTSLTNFNPTGRELGANLTTQKGEALISSITGKGEEIYQNPEYSFVFTPAVISFLRNEINAKSENGYLGENKDFDMYCSLYSDLINDPSIKGTDKDYTICNSKVLDELQNEYNAVKVHPLEDSRKKISSWLDSDYCKSNVCALVGAVGPAWK